MESSSSSSSSVHTQNPKPTRQKPLPNQIQSAIRGKSCPICLTHITHRTAAAVLTSCLHAYCIDCIRKWSVLKRRCPLCNSEFDSWFFKIDLHSPAFLREKLPGIGEGRKVFSEGLRRRTSHRLVEQWVIRRSREEHNSFSGQTRPLPRQRWFGRSESNSSDAVAQRVLQWRTSIYEQHLQAVPFSSRSNQLQKTAINSGAKERIEKKIEPWIRRELEAILGDPDPSVIVHVASSLFISSLDQKCEVSCKLTDLEDNYLEPLRPFLHERTNMFWHELRCFAESPFNMETYDNIVEYRKRSDCKRSCTEVNLPSYGSRLHLGSGGGLVLHLCRERTFENEVQKTHSKPLSDHISKDVKQITSLMLTHCTCNLSTMECKLGSVNWGSQFSC